MPIVKDTDLTIGKRIRRLRELADWTQRQLAYEARLGLTTVQEIEADNREPRSLTLQKFADVFDIPKEELGYRKKTGGNGITESVDDDRLMIDERDTQQSTIDQEDHLLTGDSERLEIATLTARILLMMNRREILQGISATALTGIGMADVIQSIQYGLNGRKVGAEVTEWARDQVAHLSYLDDFMGGKKLYPVARSNLILLRDLLRMNAVSGRNQQELQQILAHAACQAGWFAQDSERRDLAAEHYHFSIEMAQNADDRDRAAYCMIQLADMEVMSKNPRRALAKLEAAEADAGEDASLQSLILTSAAEAYGMLGDCKAASLSLAKAEALYEKRKENHVPEWLYWVPHPSMTVIAPRAFLKHDPRRSAKLSESALAQTSTSFVRDRLLLSVDLAKAKHALGEMDEALGVAGEVLHTLTKTPMTRVEKHLIEFQAELPDDPVSKQFKEHFVDYMQMRNSGKLQS